MPARLAWASAACIFKLVWYTCSPADGEIEPDDYGGGGRDSGGGRDYVNDSYNTYTCTFNTYYNNNGLYDYDDGVGRGDHGEHDDSGYYDDYYQDGYYDDGGEDRGEYDDYYEDGYYDDDYGDDGGLDGDEGVT